MSSLYGSDPVGHEDQPEFWNLATEIAWEATPEELLAALKEIERRIGRRATFRNGPREIDVDILDFGGQVRACPDPVLPHPRLATRLFALVPLAEIAPSWRHPVSGLTVGRLIEGLPTRPGVWPITGGI